MINMRISRGFTAVEILVVISIVSVLASATLVNVSSSRANTRDKVRISHIGQMQNALSLYFVDNKIYPATLNSLIPNYISGIPPDPSGGSYYYAARDLDSSPSSCESYHLGALMERRPIFINFPDKDSPISPTSTPVCTGSAADFNGLRASCSCTTPPPGCTNSTQANDRCYDVVP